MLRLLSILILLGAFATGADTLAQTAPLPAGLVGSWEGALVRGRDESTMAFTFSQQDGTLTAALTSPALGVFGMPADSVELKGNSLKIRIVRLDLEFYGTLRVSADGSALLRIDGDYYQQSEMVPIVLQSVPSPSLQ